MDDCTCGGIEHVMEEGYPQTWCDFCKSRIRAQGKPPMKFNMIPMKWITLEEAMKLYPPKD